MKKAMTFIQKFLFNPSIVKILLELQDGEKNIFQLRDAGIISVDNMLYFMDLVSIDDSGQYKVYSLTESGMSIATALNALFAAIDAALPGG